MSSGGPQAGMLTPRREREIELLEKLAEIQRKRRDQESEIDELRKERSQTIAQHEKERYQQSSNLEELKERYETLVPYGFGL